MTVTKEVIEAKEVKRRERAYRDRPLQHESRPSRPQALDRAPTKRPKDK